MKTFLYLLYCICEGQHQRNEKTQNKNSVVHIILSLQNIKFNNIMTGYMHQHSLNIQYSFMLMNC